MKSKLKISFIGAGFMSQIAHICNFHKDKRIQLHDVADYDLEMARGVKKKFNFTGQATNNANEVIKNKPDGIVLIVQRPLMNNLVKRCFNEGLNVMSEKPPAYSLSEYLKCEKLSKNKIWIKGYNRRCDPIIRYMKTNFKKYEENFGKLISVRYDILLGNSYLGAKHKIKPNLKKKVWTGVKNKFPNWLNKKFHKLYEHHLNSGCHYFDLFDFYNLEPKKNFSATINDKIFHCSFESKINDSYPQCSISIIDSRVSNWEEKIVFLFENGSCKIKLNAPMKKGLSHKLTVRNGLNGTQKILQKKNINSFEEQTKTFVDLILKKKNAFKTHYNEGKNSLKYYELVWKNYIKK